MKVTISLLLLSMAFSSYAQNSLSEEENKGLDELISTKITKEYEKIKSKSIENILNASFYSIKIENNFSSNGGFTEYKVMEVEGRILEINDISKVITVIKPEFTLKNEENAREFEKLLDILFPTFSSSDTEMYKKENQWFFVREKSFGEINGYIATIDDNGKIKSIEYTKISE